MFTSKRLLVINVDSRWFCCRIIVGHAPHVDARGAATRTHDDAFVAKWWKDLLDRCADTKTDLILLLDASARLGSNISTSAGDCGFCEQESVAGGFFHKYMLDNELCALAILAVFHTADQFTWTSLQGTRHRIDYVVLPRDWVGAVTDCSVFTDLTT